MPLVRATLDQDLDRVEAHLPLRSVSWLRWVVVGAGVVALASLVALVPLVVATTLAPMVGERPAEVQSCTWDQAASGVCSTYANAHPCLAPLRLEEAALRRRGAWIKELEPAYQGDPAGAIAGNLCNGANARAAFRALPEAERGLVRAFHEAPPALQRKNRRPRLDPSAIRRGDINRLNDLVQDQIFVNNGEVEALEPDHPSLLEAERRTLADLQRLDAIQAKLAAAVAKDEAPLRDLEIVAWEERAAEWRRGLAPVRLIRNALIALFTVAAVSFVALVGRAALRHRLRVVVDQRGVTIGRRRFRWSDLEDVELDAGRLSVHLRSGSQWHSPAVHPVPHVGAALRSASEVLLARHRSIGSSDGDDRAEDDAEAREALRALRNAASVERHG